MNREPHIRTFLRNIGCQYRGAVGCTKPECWFLLDLIGPEDLEFSLAFDCTDNPEDAESSRTADVYIVQPHGHPRESTDRIRVLTNATEFKVMRFLFALGVDRFSEKTRKALYEHNRPVRANAGAERAEEEDGRRSTR